MDDFKKIAPFLSLQDDRLMLEGLSFEEIVRHYPTPFYLYSKSTILQKLTELQKALDSTGIAYNLHYSVKANSNLSILRLFYREGGIGFDVVSMGELRRLRAIKVPLSQVVFAGVGKTEEEIAYALDRDIGLFTVESEPELAAIERVARIQAKKAPVLLRLRPGIDAQTHRYIKTAEETSKFGMDPKTVQSILNHWWQNYRHVRLLGFHVHIGSQILSPDPYEKAANELLTFADHARSLGFEIAYLSLGGGFGIPYRVGDREFPIEALGHCLESHFKAREETLLLEPGRYLVGNAGVLVSRVLYVKREGKRTILVIDAGMNDYIRPALYRAYPECLFIRKGRCLFEKQDVGDLVGPICETGDTFFTQRPIPAVEPGDYVLLLATGAYGATMSSHYNTRPFVAEVLIDGHRHYEIRKKESFTQIWQNEVLI